MLNVRAMAVCILVSSCSDTELGSFSVTEPLPVVRIPSIGISIPVPPVTIVIPSDVSALEEYSKRDYDFLTYAKPRQLRFRIAEASEQPTQDFLEDGSSDDFDFLSLLEVHISADIGGASSRVLIASLPEGDPQYGSGARELNLTLEDVDVLDYVEAPSGYDLSVTLSGNSPPDSVLIEGDVRFRIGVGFR